MSATGRSDVRRANDFYETPPKCTRALLPFLGEPKPVLDPCCGERAILDVLDDEWSGHQHTGFDLVDRGKPDVVVRDALSPLPWGHSHGIVITNPPYKLAIEFVRRALTEVSTVAMLLRLPFLESVSRQDFHRAHPADVFVFAKRPSFTANAKTDATAYAWFVWGPGRGGRWKIIPHEGVQRVAKASPAKKGTER